MNDKKINFLINFELFFEIRALYSSAIRVTNQKYNFSDTLNVYNSSVETSALILNLNAENYIKKKIEDKVKENFYTIKPRLNFLMNIMTLIENLRKKYMLTIYLYYDDYLLIKEEEQTEFFNYMKGLVKNNGVENFFIISEKNLLKKIENKIFSNNENIIIDFSKIKIVNFLNSLANFKLFYKPPNKKNFDCQEECDEKELFSQIALKKIPFYDNYDDFLKSFYNIEEYKFHKEYEANQVIFKFFPSYLNKEFAFINYWKLTKTFSTQIILNGKVITGFQRGSRQLGVPTANLQMTTINNEKINNLLSGIYVGFCKFETNNLGNIEIDIKRSYKAVMSIGWNPYFDNAVKTIEVFIIDYEGDNFYDEELQISITSFIRTEANFENFGELVTAITYDIIRADNILSISNV